MSDLSPSGPAAIAILGGEGLRPESSPIWKRLRDLAGGQSNEVAILSSALASLPMSQADRRTQTARVALEAMGMTVRMIAADDNLMPSGLLYLPGGDQRMVVEQLSDSTLLRELLESSPVRVLAASGASAVALGDQVFAPVRPYPAEFGRLEFEILPGLGLLKGVVILPYFSWLPDEVTQKIATLAGPNTLVGIDDQAALIGYAGTWEVGGHGTVSFLSSSGKPRVFDAGALIPGDDLLPYPQR